MAHSWPVLNHTIFTSLSINFLNWKFTVVRGRLQFSFLAYCKLTEVEDFHILEDRGVNLHAEVPYSHMCVLVFTVTPWRPGAKTKGQREKWKRDPHLVLVEELKKEARMGLLKPNLDWAVNL